MLQHRELVPGVKGNDRLQYWRQITDLVEHAAPFLQTLVLVPIKIVDQRIPFPGGPSAFGGAGLADRRAGDVLLVPAQMSESTSPAPTIEFMND